MHIHMLDALRSAHNYTFLHSLPSSKFSLLFLPRCHSERIPTEFHNLVENGQTSDNENAATNLSLMKLGQHEMRLSLLMRECSFVSHTLGQDRSKYWHSRLKLVLQHPAWSTTKPRFSSLVAESPTELDDQNKAKTSAGAGPWLGISGQISESKPVGTSSTEGQCQQDSNK